MPEHEDIILNLLIRDMEQHDLFISLEEMRGVIEDERENRKAD